MFLTMISFLCFQIEQIMINYTIPFTPTPFPNTLAVVKPRKCYIALQWCIYYTPNYISYRCHIWLATLQLKNRWDAVFTQLLQKTYKRLSKLTPNLTGLSLVGNLLWKIVQPHNIVIGSPDTYQSCLCVIESSSCNALDDVPKNKHIYAEHFLSLTTSISPTRACGGGVGIER